MPSGWSIESTGRSTTTPTNATTPSPAARTAAPSAPATSTPRCPADQGSGWSSNVATTSPASGIT